MALLLITVVSGLFFIAQKPVSVQAAATPTEYSISVGLYNASTNAQINIVNTNLTFLEQDGYYYVQHTNSSYNTNVDAKPAVSWHSVLGSGISSSQYIKVQVGNSTWPTSDPINVTFRYGMQFGVNAVSGSDNDISFTLKYLSSTSIQHTLAYSNVADKQQSYPATATNFSNMNISIAILKEDMVPVISGEVAFVTNVDNPINPNVIKQNLVAWDDEDGDISNQISMGNSTYPFDLGEDDQNTGPSLSPVPIGNYEIEYTVFDSAMNQSSLTVHVLVKDITFPEISGGQDTYTIGYKETLNIEQIRASLVGSDNYDEGVDVVIKTNDYTVNKSQIGTYQVVFSATDTSLNETTKTIQVHVVDNVSPTFSGPTTLSKPKNQVLTESQIRSQLTANDEISGNRTANITLVTDNYTGKGALVGSYTLTYAVSDAAGNQKQHTVTVSVIDDTGAWWFMRDGYFISVPDSVTLTRQQIIDILVATDQLVVEATTYINFVLDEYAGNESEPGIYAMSIKTTSVNGTESVKNMAIQVTSETNTGGDIVIDAPLTHWGQYGSYYLIGLGGLLFLLVALAVFMKPRKKSQKRRRFR